VTLSSGQKLSFPATAAAGSKESFKLPAGSSSAIVQAVDAAGNLGLAVTVPLT
jgi:hypothetical protein